MMPYNPIYGNYRNRKFTDIWEDADNFWEEYNASPIKGMSETEIKTIYYLLYARYGNSTIASFDETQFKYGVFSTIFSFGPTWAKRLEIQDELRQLTLDQIQTGSKTIFNQASNPGTAPSTASLSELTYINQQNTATTKRSPIEGYAILVDLLETDVTTQFIGRFAKLFLRVVQPEMPLWFVTEDENIPV